MWDGKELEGEPEEIEEEELEPFVRLSDGMIRHFSHEHHHLKLNEETDDRAYDDTNLVKLASCLFITSSIKHAQILLVEYIMPYIHIHLL